ARRPGRARTRGERPPWFTTVTRPGRRRRPTGSRSCPPPLLGLWWTAVPGGRRIGGHGLVGTDPPTPAAAQRHRRGHSTHRHLAGAVLRPRLRPGRGRAGQRAAQRPHPARRHGVRRAVHQRVGGLGGFTFYANRFDTDNLVYRLAKLAGAGLGAPATRAPHNAPAR